MPQSHLPSCYEICQPEPPKHSSLKLYIHLYTYSFEFMHVYLYLYLYIHEQDRKGRSVPLQLFKIVQLQFQYEAASVVSRTGGGDFYHLYWWNQGLPRCYQPSKDDPGSIALQQRLSVTHRFFVDPDKSSSLSMFNIAQLRYSQQIWLNKSQGWVVGYAIDGLVNAEQMSRYPTWLNPRPNKVSTYQCCWGELSAHVSVPQPFSYVFPLFLEGSNPLFWRFDYGHRRPFVP